MITEKVLVLRKVRYGEADLILTCLTQGGRVLSLIAKSALKSKKRFGGGILEPIHYLNITYNPARGEGDKLAVLTEATLLQDFKGIREDYEKLDFALHVMKTVAHVSNEGEVHSKALFDLVGHTLTVAQLSKRLPWLRTQFETKFLHQQGVLPPEGAFQQLMTTSLKDHENLQLTDDQWIAVRARLRYHLDSYLG